MNILNISYNKTFRLTEKLSNFLFSLSLLNSFLTTKFLRPNARSEALHQIRATSARDALTLSRDLQINSERFHLEQLQLCLECASSLRLVVMNKQEFCLAKSDVGK